MEYRGLTLQQAADLVVQDKLVHAGGTGGIIGVDHDGHVAISFNSVGMFRGFAKADGNEGIYLFKDEGIR
jgi:L-asparaginase / beta-aspartyl-peptidase